MPVAADLSDEATALNVRLKESDEVEVFQAFEDWVFEKGLDEEERKERVREALVILPYPWSRSQHALQLEGFQKRLVQRFPQSWWAWVAAAELIDHSPTSVMIREEGFERLRRWRSGTHGVADHDRVLTIQFLRKAVELAIGAKISGDELAEIYLNLATKFDSLQGDGNAVLTDLATLPDPNTNGILSRARDGARLDQDGKLQLPALRGSFEETRTDYERSLWCLQQAEKVAEKKAEVKYKIAHFWHDLLGVDQVAYAGYIYIEGTESEFDMEAPGEFELHTLTDDETLVVGEDGPRRVILPEHCQYIRMMREVIEDETASVEIRGRAAEDLSDTIYADRRQFERVVELMQRMDRLRSHDEKEDDEGVFAQYYSTDPGVEWDAGGSFAAGTQPEVTLYSRGLDEVELEVWKIDVDQLWNNPDSGDLESLVFERRPVSLPDTNHEGKDIRKEHEWFEEGCDLVKRWKVPVRRKPNLLQTTTVAEVPVRAPGNYLVVRRSKEGREVLPLEICDVALVSGGSVRSGYEEGSACLYAVDPSSGKALEGVELKQNSWGEDEEYAISDHTGRFQEFGAKSDLVWGQVWVRWPDSAWVVGRVSSQSGSVLWSDDVRWQSFLVMNQPLYRPGQKVSLAGWLRESPRWTGREPVIPKGMPLRMRVTDPTGREVWMGETKLDDFGGFTGEFQLSDEVVLGDYRVDLIEKRRVEDDFDPFEERNPVFKWDKIGSTHWWVRSWTFEVGEFRKPDFQVAIEPVEGGDGFEVMVVATYLSGEPVKGAPVVGGLEGTPDLVRFHPKRRWDDLFGEGYQWGLPLPVQIEGWQNWAMWREGDARNYYDGQDYSVVSRAEGVTDETGRVRLRFEAEFPFLDQFPYKIGIKVGVTAMSGRRIGARKLWTHTGRSFEVFARPLQGFYRSGERVEVEVGVIDVEGRPREGKGLLKLERIGGEGFEPVLEREVRVDRGGSAVVSFEAPAGGQYRCVFEGGGSERGFVVEVVGDGGTRGKYDGLQIIPRDFLVDDSGRLEVLVRTDEPSAEVWVFESVPNGHRRTPRRVTTQNHTALIEVPVHPSQRPNFFIEAMTFVKGRPVRTSCRVLYPDEASRLEVGMALDEEVGKPGGKAAVDFEVSDHEGGPAEAALVLTVFDRSLEDLAGGLPSTARLRKKFSDSVGAQSSMDERWREESLFQGMWEPGVFSERDGLEGEVERRKSSRFVLIGREIWNGYHPPSFGGGGGAGFPVTPATPSTFQMSRESGLSDDEFGLVDQVQVRSKFADRAYWGGALRTDQDGRLRVDFELPENLTSWRVQSWAFGKGRSFGEAELELPVSKELQVRPMMPRAAVVGDELLLGAMVQNLSKIRDTFILKFEVEGASVENPGGREITLEGGEEGLAQWKVVMDKPGGVVFRVKAVGRETKLADGFEHRVPLAAREVQRTVSDSAFIKGGQVGAKLEILSDPGMKGRSMTVRVEAHPAVGALMVLPDLVDYPHGCVEQTLNRFLPLMIATKATDQLGLDWEAMSHVMRKRGDALGWISGREVRSVVHSKRDLSVEKVQDMIQVGIHRLGELQKDDGSWGWFSANDPESRVDLTALAVRGLIMADAKGRDGERSYAIRRGVDWLERWSTLKVSRETKVRTLAEAAYVAWVLREAGSKKTEGLLKELWAVREMLPLTSRIQFFLAMVNSPEREVLEGEIRKVMEGSQIRSNSPGTWWNERVERRAYYLKMLVKIGAKKELLDREIQALLNARVDGIRWRSTRESALCVEAILEASLVEGMISLGRDESMKVTVDGLGQKRVVSLSLKNLWSETVEISVSGKDLEERENLALNVSRTGANPFFVVASISHPSSDPKVMREQEAGVKLERRYYRVTQDGNRVLVKEGEALNVGEIIEVELEINSDQPREFLHLRDPIPGGLEPLMQLSGYHQSAYRESRTGESHFFITELSDWNRRHRYALSVVTEGASMALPAQVECMYAPEIRGRSAARVFQVERE